jgi:23S rRNA (guanosine2251-2'-O)-methyltransferase
LKTGQRGQFGSIATGRRPEPRSAGGGAFHLPPDSDLLYGRNAVREALRAAKRVRRLLVAQGSERDEVVAESIRLAERLSISPEMVPRERLDSLVPDNQGIVAVAAPFEYVGWGDLLNRLKAAAKPPAVLMLDTLHDPQNLGTLVRTSEAIGVDALVLPKRRSVQVTPAVVRSSSGGVEHMSVARVPNLVRAALDLKEIGFWVAGIDMDGDRLYWELDMSGPTALVLGGEDHGIGQLMKETCDFLVRLPMLGKVNSLNAAVAGSVVLYEMARQRSVGQPAGS